MRRRQEQVQVSVRARQVTYLLLTYLHAKVTTKLASDVLKALLSGDNENEDDAYQLGEKITNDHYDRFVAVARTANVAECPAAAGHRPQVGYQVDQGPGRPGRRGERGDPEADDC